MTTLEIIFGTFMVLFGLTTLIFSIKNVKLNKRNTELAEMNLIPYLNIRTKIQWWEQIIIIKPFEPSEEEKRSFGIKLYVDNSGKGPARKPKRYWALVLKNGKVHSGEIKTRGHAKTFVGGADSGENTGDWVDTIKLDHAKEKKMVDKICWFVTYKDNNNNLYYSCASFKLIYKVDENPYWEPHRESQAYPHIMYKRRCDDCPFKRFNKRKIVELLFSKMFNLKSLHFKFRLTKDVL